MVFKKQSRKKKFYALLGYRSLIKEKSFKDIRFQINKLHHTTIKTISFKPLFFNETIDNEIFLRQYLIQFLSRKLYFSSLMKTGGKKNISFTGPSEWMDENILGKKNKSKIINLINLYFFSFNRIIKSILLFYNILKNNVFLKPPTNKSTAYFYNLEEGCLPSRLNKNEKTIVSWYIGWIGKLKNLKTIGSNLEPKKINQSAKVNFINNTHPEYYIGFNYNFFRFILLYLSDLFMSIFYLSIGNVGNAIMLPELMLYRIAKFTAPNNIAGHYLFQYTLNLYRPLWTYMAEKKGSRISLYFSSLNVEIMSPFSGLDDSYSYFPLSWPECIVWTDLIKKKVIKHSIIKPQIYVENFIPFKALEYKKITIPKKCILIFDLEPQKLTKYIQEHGFCPHSEYVYYNKPLYRKFFNDILDLSFQYGYSILHKRKRFIKDKNVLYDDFINELEKNVNFQSIDPNYDLVELIENATATISQPFTSVSYLANSMNKLSIYYDPINYIRKNDEARSGVSLISGRKELNKWFKSI